MHSSKTVIKAISKGLHSRETGQPQGGASSHGIASSVPLNLHFRLNSARNVFDLLIIRANPPDYDTDLMCQDGSGKFRELSAKKLQSLPSVLTDRSK